MILLFFTAKTDRKLKHETLSLIIRVFYVNLLPGTLDYAVLNGASTFAKAMAKDKDWLRDFINRLKDIEDPEAIMKTCEDELNMADLEIACDATYVSTLNFLLN